jgi:4-hydroxy-tetrahydrodipicolinate reductase
MSDLKIAVVGGAGRMGQTLVRLAQQTAGLKVTSATESKGHPSIGDDLGALTGLGALGVTLSDDPEHAFKLADAVIDFTTPAATLRHAEIAAARKLIYVIGTTGISESDEQAIVKASEHATIVKASNMSLGINLLVQLTKTVAEVLDVDFDIEIMEMHHRLKVDAPSGTALMLGEAAAKGRGVKLGDVAERGRDGHTGERAPGQIGFAALRAGSVVGEHKVIFAADHERIELGHIAEDRAIFARGALKAALWARNQPAGLYSMADVLGF